MFRALTFASYLSDLEIHIPPKKQFLLKTPRDCLYCLLFSRFFYEQNGESASSPSFSQHIDRSYIGTSEYAELTPFGMTSMRIFLQRVKTLESFHKQSSSIGPDVTTSNASVVAENITHVVDATATTGVVDLAAREYIFEGFIRRKRGKRTFWKHVIRRENIINQCIDAPSTSFASPSSVPPVATSPDPRIEEEDDVINALLDDQECPPR
nr:hypothetical protein Iba_chr12fCG17090 [Ipomoea batatas]